MLDVPNSILLRARVFVASRCLVCARELEDGHKRVLPLRVRELAGGHRFPLARRAPALVGLHRGSAADAAGQPDLAAVAQ